MMSATAEKNEPTMALSKIDLIMTLKNVIGLRSMINGFVLCQRRTRVNGSPKKTEKQHFASPFEIIKTIGRPMR